MVPAGGATSSTLSADEESEAAWARSIEGASADDAPWSEEQAGQALGSNGADARDSSGVAQESDARTSDGDSGVVAASGESLPGLGSGSRPR